MRFDYYDAASLKDACAFLAKHYNQTKIIAGGTDLYVQLRQKALVTEYVLDIANIPDLDSIVYDEQHGWRLGALTRIRALEKSAELQQKCPVIAQAAGCLGSVAVRNQATLGGNLCNASPSAEMAPALIGLSAQARIAGFEGERVIPLEDFFIGPGKTVLKQDEILIKIQIPPSAANIRGVYFKHAPRGSIDLAITGVAVVGEYEADNNVFKDLKIAMGAVGPRPMRALQAERLVKNVVLEDSLIEKSAQQASQETAPITDVRATEWYRREMVKVLTRKALHELAAEVH